MDIDKAPTVYEVARHAGVSTATVSRALTDANKLRPATRERVLTAARELGYVPSGSARGLAARRTGVLGLCFPELGDPEAESGGEVLYSDEVIRGMERAARKSSYAVLIAASHGDEAADLVLTMAGRTDGLAVLARTVPTPLLERISRRVPVVMLAGPPELDHLDHVAVDNERGARELTSHLIDQHGFTDIAFVSGPPASPDSAERLSGCAAALHAAGLPGPRHLRGDFTEPAGRAAVTDLIAAHALPRAMVCANDQMAVGAMAELRTAGVSVPADVAIVGFDDIALGRHVVPQLTTVRQPMRQLGEKAVELLQQRLADRERPAQSIRLPVHVEIRQSCGCALPANQDQRPGNAALRPSQRRHR